jgi:hypothetical protein
MTDRYADLHLHTTASDGTQSIQRLTERVALCGISTIAITDHDTISSELSKRMTEIGDVEVITGVEIKVDYDGIRGEVLGYFVDPNATSLRDLFAFMQRAREVRMQRMIERCADQIGVAITLDEVRALTTGSVGRPHLARILVGKGVVPSMSEAFRRYIKQGRPCYVPLEKPDFREAAHAIHAAGGVTAIPHPCLMEIEDWHRFLGMVHAEGIDGIEVFYPYERSNGVLTIDPAVLQEMVAKHGFLLTGGSDDHGPDSVKESLGTVRLPYCYVEALKRACGLL